MGFLFVKKGLTPEQWDEFDKLYNLETPLSYTHHTPYGDSNVAVDKEVGAFLFGLGGRGDVDSGIPEYFALIWGGGRAIIERMSIPAGDHYKWDVTSIKASASLQDKSDELVQVIKDAFAAYGEGLGDEGRPIEYGRFSLPVFEKEEGQ